MATLRAEVKSLQRRRATLRTQLELLAKHRRLDVRLRPLVETFRWPPRSLRSH